jgi:hypothetical protein
MSVVIPTIAFVRKTKLLTDATVSHYVTAQQIQIVRDWTPAWGSGAHCLFVPKGRRPPPDCWQCLLLDNSDQADALGYHDLTSDGLPVMKVFVADDMRDGLAWTVTASHEVLETLADPWIDNTIPVTKDGISVEYAREVADTCEADEFAYPINGVYLTDFALPSWFDPNGKEPFTFRRTVHAPFALAPGGYIGVRETHPVAGEWTQRFGDGAPTARMVKGAESRTMRRFAA